VSPNGQTPPTGWAGQRDDLVRSQHARLAAQRILDLAVVQPRRARCHDEQHAILDLEGESLGDLRRLYAVSTRGQLYRGGAGVQLDNLDIGGMHGQERAHGLYGHAAILASVGARSNSGSAV
jgi:hypothetical protein